MLVERAAYHLSDRSVGGLLLHAAAVSHGGRCVLLPGKTSAGKSTLTAWLVARECRYLTDELVYIPAGTTTAVPFTRPLNIRASGLAALEAKGVDVSASGAEVLHAPSLALVRPPVSASGIDQPPPEIAFIAFPRYEADASFSATAMSKAEAGLNLMACLINARNLADHGHPEVARLAREVPAFRVTYSDVGLAEEWMAALGRGHRPQRARDIRVRRGRVLASDEFRAAR